MGVYRECIGIHRGIEGVYREILWGLGSRVSRS